jgi:hypothetical protein
MDRVMSVDDPALESLARSFLLGTGRNPAPIDAAFKRLAGSADGASELAALALLGQRMRFRKPGPAPAPDEMPAVADPRAIVPDAARALMRRLLGSKDGTDDDIANLAVADACNRRRLRPHPFDLPRLSGFVKRHGELLGATASAWAARGEAEAQPASFFDADAIDETNWTLARPAARTAFIAALRAREPERARALVEASFASDAAPVRARLLGALARGLSAADVPFLESLAKDRAPSVREEAQRLLKFIPGTPASQDRLRDFVARTKAGTAGLLRRRKILTLERPAHLQVAHERLWAASEYVGLPLGTMAAAFALTVPDMIAAASDDVALIALFARQASIERRFDLLATIVRDHAADAWVDALEGAELADDATADEWCAAALAPQLWPSLPNVAELVRLYGILRRPLPLAQARELMQSRAFATIHGGEWSSHMRGSSCVVLVALVPAVLRGELRAAFGSLPHEDVARASLLLDCVTLLDPPAPENP